MDAYSLITMVLAFLAIVALAFVQFRGNPAAASEDDDRAFFDEHGRWPEEPESAARMRPGGYAGVDDLPKRE